MRYIVYLLAGICVLVGAPAYALNTIRDAETEALIREISDPLFDAAGLPKQNIRIILVNDNALNAFVAGGQNIFLNTGIVTWSNDPAVLAGVIAHETGHIVGGHLARFAEDADQYTTGAILSMLLGAASIAAGSPAAGQAIMVGGQHAMQRGILSYTRTHENSADQAAIDFMRKAGYPMDGLYKLFSELERRSLSAQGTSRDPYAQTHPLSRERMDVLKNYIQNEQPKNLAMKKSINTHYARVVAKVQGFLGDLEYVKNTYKGDTIPDLIARAVIAHRMSKKVEAFALMDQLLMKEPQNPYFFELKGQIAYENGDIDTAISAYRSSLHFLPEQPLLMQGLADSLLAKNARQENAEAAKLLEQVVKAEPTQRMAWRQLATAYGREGQLGRSYLALAEESALSENSEEAQRFLKLARQHGPNDSIMMLRIEDLESVLKSKKKKDG